MTDKVLVRPGTGRGEVAVDKAYFHDNSDGSYSLGDAAHAYGWNTSTLAWSKLPVDTSTGALLVSATLAAGSVDIGKVDQGTPGVSAWPVSLGSLPSLASGSNVIGHVLTDSGSVATVSIAANQTVTANPTRPATGTTSSPASVTTSVATVLASNSGRYGATVYNESGATAYIKFGTAATVTDYTIQVAVGGYYEVPFGYTGVLTGITSSGTAVLRVTEITA